MAVSTGNGKFAEELLKALNLPLTNIRALDFRIAHKEISTVKVEYFPENGDGIEKLPSIIQKYKIEELKEIEEGSNHIVKDGISDVTALGQEFSKFQFCKEDKNES